MNGLGILAGLSALPGGLMQGDEWRRRRQYEQLALQQHQQQQQQQQQAAGAAWSGLQAGLGGGAPQQPPQHIPQLQSVLPQQQAAPQTPPMARGVNWQGQNPQFQQRVSDMMAAAPPDVRGGMQVTSGFRTPQQQAEIYQRSGQGQNFMAAPPGHSRHESGTAADWQFKTPQADQWAHQNAGRFGLGFPLAKDPNHMQALGPDMLQKAQTFAKLGAPAPVVQESRDIAMGVAQEIPQQDWGRASLKAASDAIDKTGAAPAAKFMALSMVAKILAPEERMQLQQYMAANRQQLMVGLAEMRADIAQMHTRSSENIAQMRVDAAERHANQPAKQGFQILEDPTTKQQFMMVPGRPETAQTLSGEPYKPGGAAKLGGGAKEGQGQQFTDGDVEYWANVLRNGGHFPPGLARTRGGSEFVQRVMAKMPGMGGGDPGAFIANVATVKADDRSLSNMTKMADAATSFEKTASLNFDTALKLSKDAVPTDWGPWLNRWIMSGQTQFGDVDVPPYVTAMLTGANEYAKIMSGSTGAQGSTVDSRREAAELFSPYLSAGQIDRVVAVAKTDMDNRKQSLYGQIDDIKGRLRTAGSDKPTATMGQKPKYTVGQIIEQGGKKYRITGGDLEKDPDVEPAQ